MPASGMAIKGRGIERAPLKFFLLTVGSFVVAGGFGLPFGTWQLFVEAHILSIFL